jgi:valyl-tRNA synthetase
MHLLDQYGSDAVRYWSLSAKLGTDTIFDEKVLKVGRRLVTKLFNAAKFVLAQQGPEGAVTHPLDRGFLVRLSEVVEQATAALEALDYSAALGQSERFFWGGFTDSYVEIVKARARSESDPAGRASAVAALQLGLTTLLRLFAPFLPYIAEEVWSWTHDDSIHRAPWPIAAELRPQGASLDDARVYDAATECLDAIHKAKSGAGASVGRHVARLSLRVAADRAAALGSALPDALAAARVQQHELEVGDTAEGGIVVVSLELAPPPAEP